MKAATVFALSAVAALTQAHGLIKTPEPRQPGKAFAKVCSENIYNQATADELQRAGPIEIWELVGSNMPDWDGAACNIFQCKGFKLEDNVDSVQVYEVGQEVEMTAAILATHGGYANVSVIDLKANTVIGEPLKVWESYDPPGPTPPEDNLKWNVKIPEVANVCKEPGDCAIQWYWFTPNSNQSYEECVDFVV